MPRLARKYLESNYFHITIQGINREYIFEDDNLKEAYLNILKKNLKETNINILAYCIMDNHAHFLVYCEDTTEISKLMQRSNTSFAILYNKLNDRVGYVFRNRYCMQMILNEIQLFNCLVYIHNNPVKAHIVDSPKKYLYSISEKISMYLSSEYSTFLKILNPFPYICQVVSLFEFGFLA